MRPNTTTVKFLVTPETIEQLKLADSDSRRRGDPELIWQDQQIACTYSDIILDYVSLVDTPGLDGRARKKLSELVELTGYPVSILTKPGVLGYELKFTYAD